MIATLSCDIAFTIGLKILEHCALFQTVSRIPTSCFFFLQLQEKKIIMSLRLLKQKLCVCPPLIDPVIT